MRAVITVTGKDTVGILARVSTMCAKYNANVIEVSQTRNNFVQHTLYEVIRMLSVQIVLFDGFDLLDAIAPYEVFCAAQLFADDALNVEFVTAEGPRTVTAGFCGIMLDA